jgi:PLP dependent protein
MSIEANLNHIQKNLGEKVTLVAVSKTKSNEEILEAYNAGQRDFGENYVQELIIKQPALPNDIRWHYIGHLQSNKVKYIAPFVNLIHGVDSLKLLKEIDKQGKKNNRVIECLLQVFIASEETKFGLDENEVKEILHSEELGTLSNVRVKGLMGMASFTEDEKKIRMEFRSLKKIYDQHPGLTVLSMGMSSDYKIAVEEGSNLVRVGSAIFGVRTSVK